MGKRVTIIVDDDLDKKIREKQGYLIKSTLKSVSYSSVINDILRNSFKTTSKEKSQS